MNKQIIGLMLVFTSCVVNAVVHKPFTQIEKISASNTAQKNYFGRSIATSGRTLAIGATSDMNSTEHHGVVYIYVDSNSDGRYQDERQIKLTAFDGGDFDAFGLSIALHSDKLAVGAPHSSKFSSNGGSVYIYSDSDRDGDYSDEVPQKLTDPDGDPNRLFGYRVALSNRLLAVGMPFDNHRGENSGSVYVYYDSDNDGLFTDEPPQKLQAPNPRRDSRFGYSIAVSENTIVIGSPWQQKHTGGAYVFTDSNNDGKFTDEVAQTLPRTFPQNYEYFGQSVDIYKSTIAIGAPKANRGTGAVYVYHDTNQDGVYDNDKRAIIIASDGYKQDQFGETVKLSQSRLAVASFRDDAAAYAGGSIYIYRDSNKNNRFVDEKPKKLKALNAQKNDNLGYALALTNQALFASSIKQYIAERRGQGSVHHFTLPPIQGTGNFVESSQEFAFYTANAEVLFGDLDGDKDLDMLVGANIMLNDGQGRFESSGYLTINSASMALGDLDSDGDLDVIVSADERTPLAVFLNNGEAKFSRIYQTFNFKSRGDVAIADINGDNVQDLIFATSKDLYQSTIAVQFGNNSGRFSQFSNNWYRNGKGLGHDIAVSDFNNDGTNDLFVSNLHQDVRGETLLIRDGQIRNVTYAGEPNSSTVSVSAADVDKDGDIDLLKGGLEWQ